MHSLWSKMSICFLVLYTALKLGVCIADQTLVGTEFLFVFPIEYSSSTISGSYIVINNHEQNMAMVSVTTPKDTTLLNERLHINGNSFEKIFVPEDVFSTIFDPAQENSIYIEVTNNVKVDVTVVIFTAYAAESFVVFPLSLLGNTYNVIAPKMSNDSYSFVSIVFAKFSNSVTLTFHKMVDLVAFNQHIATRINMINPITAEINIKYAYSVLTLWYDNDMTGLQITSNTEIAVFAGCVYMTFLNNGNPKIFMIDQVPPTIVLGRDYIINRFGTLQNGGVFVLATSDNTSVMAYNDKRCFYEKFNNNDWDHFDINSDILFISSREPIAVAHILKSATSNPSMYYATPMDGFQKFYEFYIPSIYEKSDIYGVTVFTSDSNSLTLNSQSVSANSTGSYDLDIGDVSYSALEYTPDPGQINRINHTSANFGGYVYYGHGSSLILHTLGGQYFQRNMTCKTGNNIPGCITPKTSCPYSVPSIRIPNENSSFIYGGNITMHCLIIAHPAITTFSWGVNTSTGFTNITSGGSYTVDTETTTDNRKANVTLTISNVTFVEKTYTCRASNNIGDEFASVTLHILGVNDGGQSVVTRPMATPAVATTTTAAATKATTTTVTTTHSTFSVTTIATTTSTTKTSNMIPFVSAGPLTLFVNSGQNVTLTCNFIGPVTSVYWQKYQDGMVMKIDPTMNPSKTSGATIAVPSLQIHGVSLYDEASYKCFAVNIDKTGSSDYVKLDILDQKLVTFVHIPEDKKVGYLDRKKTEIEKELSVNRKTLSSSIRRTTCAPDSRPSATAAGAVGTSLMLVVFGLLAMLDITVLISALKAQFLTSH